MKAKLFHVANFSSWFSFVFLPLGFMFVLLNAILFLFLQSSSFWSYVFASEFGVLGSMKQRMGGIITPKMPFYN
jgi:hypothetical protein